MPDQPPTTEDTRFEPYIGRLMKDGTVFADISPDSHKPLYTTVADAPLRMNFNDASGYATALEVNNKKSFRLPTLAEMDMICDNGYKGALKGTFNQDPVLEEVDPDVTYWTSDIADDAGSFLTLMTKVFNQSVSTSRAGEGCLLSVRYVRDGNWPTAETVVPTAEEIAAVQKSHETAMIKQERLKRRAPRMLAIESA